MKQLKKQIGESFFNPILYFLPALVFMLADDFWGENVAWKISFPVAFALLFYIYFIYRRMFLWHGMLALGYLIIGSVATIVPDTHPLLKYVDEKVFIVLVLILILKKKSLANMASKTLPHELPMSNNENELFRVAKVLLSIVVLFTASALILELWNFQDSEIILKYVKILYLSSVVFVALFETARVFIVRHRLMNEDWLPIVDESGQVTGSVQYQPDAISRERLMHPVVRLYFIEDGKIFLQQRKADDRNEPLFWDASLSRMVRMSESTVSVLKRLTQKLYNFEPTKFLFLTNYIYRGKRNDQYIYLFVLCKSDGLQPQQDEFNQTKWWTQRQIEAELGAGVFTERFEQEYKILKRSGLLETESGCDCECTLREVIRTKI